MINSDKYEKAFTADMADAKADGRAAANAPKTPPLSNRGGAEKSGAVSPWSMKNLKNIQLSLLMVKAV